MDCDVIDDIGVSGKTSIICNIRQIINIESMVNIQLRATRTVSGTGQALNKCLWNEQMSIF